MLPHALAEGIQLGSNAWCNMCWLTNEDPKVMLCAKFIDWTFR